MEQCPKCGYVLGPLETECARCARMLARPSDSAPAKTQGSTDLSHEPAARSARSKSDTARFIVLTVVTLGVYAMWIHPVVEGLKWARLRGVSPYWMWFGIHPLGGWIAYSIIRWYLPERPLCPSCGRAISPSDMFCLQCGAPLTPGVPYDSVSVGALPPPEVGDTLDGPERGAESEPARASVRVLHPGQWFLLDVPIEIWLDGERVGRGSAVRGTNVVFETCLGTHTLVVGPWYRKGHRLLHLDQPRDYVVHLAYDRVLGRVILSKPQGGPPGTVALPRPSVYRAEGWHDGKMRSKQTDFAPGDYVPSKVDFPGRAVWVWLIGLPIGALLGTGVATAIAGNAAQGSFGAMLGMAVTYRIIQDVQRGITRQKGRQHYQELADREPKNADACVQAGLWIHEHAKQVTEIERGDAYYRRALARNPGHRDATISLALSLSRNSPRASNHRAAVNLLQPWLADHDDFRGELALAESLKALGEHAQAAVHVRRLLKMHPEMAQEEKADHEAYVREHRA
jgi:hypothetical protein